MANPLDQDIVEPDVRQKPPPREAAPGPQVVTTDTARQGPLGWPVAYVLGFGIAGAVLTLGLAWIIFGMIAG